MPWRGRQQVSTMEVLKVVVTPDPLATERTKKIILSCQCHVTPDPLATERTKKIILSCQCHETSYISQYNPTNSKAKRKYFHFRSDNYVRTLLQTPHQFYKERINITSQQPN
jgi:hypothetical protein